MEQVIKDLTPYQRATIRLWGVLHQFSSGNNVTVCGCVVEPTVKMVVEALQIDYEPEKGESIQVFELGHVEQFTVITEPLHQPTPPVVGDSVRFKVLYHQNGHSVVPGEVGTVTSDEGENYTIRVATGNPALTFFKVNKNGSRHTIELYETARMRAGFEANADNPVIEPPAVSITVDNSSMPVFTAGQREPIEYRRPPESTVTVSNLPIWSVVVGNIGTVYTGNEESVAKSTYDEYVCQSKECYGRAGNEEVNLFKDGYLERSHVPQKPSDEGDESLLGIFPDVDSLGGHESFDGAMIAKIMDEDMWWRSNHRWAKYVVLAIGLLIGAAVAALLGRLS